jgi:hypothetical protein
VDLAHRICRAEKALSRVFIAIWQSFCVYNTAPGKTASGGRFALI